MPLKVQNTALMMNLLMAFILAFYFQKWHFMAFWDSKFGIPLDKKVGNTLLLLLTFQSRVKKRKVTIAEFLIQIVLKLYFLG